MTDIKDDQPTIEVELLSEIHKQYELAARIYCDAAGVDPDEGIPMPHPLGLQIPYTVPQWIMAAEKLYDFSLMLTSLKKSAEPGAKAPKKKEPSRIVQ